MSKKIMHYNIDEIDKHNARINLIWGERSNGKSYQVKHKKGIEKYLKTGKRFILMRRWKEEISSDKIEQYFADVDVEKLTEGKYNCVSMYKKQLYLANYDNQTGHTKRVERIGYVVALSTEQNYAGASYLDVEDIIFEEFMSRSVYIPNEADKLMNFLSTVDRKRNIVRLWLVGNTISRVCPYLQDWDLTKLVSHQKQGEIIDVYIGTGTYDNDGKEYKVHLAIEYCKNNGTTSFAIGKHRDMLNKGSWQTEPQPHLPKSRRDYKRLFNMYFQYKGFKFACEYICDKMTFECCWFIYPYTKEIPDKYIVFSDDIKVSPYWQKDIYMPLIKNKKICDLLKTFRLNNIFFASDLCGTDFKQAIDFEIRK